MLPVEVGAHCCIAAVQYNPGALDATWLHTTDAKRSWWTVVTINAETCRKVAVDISCTPAQHFTGRSLWDRFKTLWASWVVEEVRPRDSGPGVKVFFGGDTGYRAVPDGKNEDEVPVCPVFKEIGERFGGFDFAMIPIGYVISLYLRHVSSGRLIA